MRFYGFQICKLVFGELNKIHFENICREDHDISLGDETTKIFLNADSSMEDVSRELRAFLDYVAGRKSEDDFIKKLEAAVEAARKNREWRHEYMTLLMRDQENIEKGIEKGIERGKREGEEQMLDLIQKLINDGRTDEVSRIKEDKAYRQKLYREYGIL